MGFTSVPEDQRQEHSTIFDNLRELVIKVDRTVTMICRVAARRPRVTPALYLYPFNGSFVPKHITLLP